MVTTVFRRVYQVAAWLVFADVVLQFYFAGVGVFTVPGNDFSFLQVVFFILSEVFGGSVQKSSGLPTYVASLHVVNGLLIFGLAGFLALRAHALPIREAAVAATRPAPEPSA